MEKLSVSQEDYLEEIYNQIIKNGAAKVTAISEALDVKKASVTNALQQLSLKKLINYAPYSAITLTEEGEILAKQILKRHKTMMSFFIDILGLDAQQAEENACKMEHIMSDELFDRTLKLAEFLKEYSSNNPAFAQDIRKIFS